MELVRKIAIILTLIGGLNWGLVGVLNLDLVALIFGPMTILSRIVYTLVGLSSIYLIFDHPFGKKE